MPAPIRFEKEGLEDAPAGHLRLLVHCEGVPPFLCVAKRDSTVAELVAQVSKQYKSTFCQHSYLDIAPIKIRWLEDCQHHALPPDSPVGLLLTDRESVFAVTRVDIQYSESSSADQIILRWRTGIEDTALMLSALAHNDEARQQVHDAGGLQCLLCMVCITLCLPSPTFPSLLSACDAPHTKWLFLLTGDPRWMPGSG